MEVDGYIAALEDAGARLGRAAAKCQLDDPVPTCPGWAVRDLLQHIGGVHRWATSLVATGKSNPAGADQFFAPVPEAELLEQYHDGLAALVGALASAHPDLDCWTFLPAPSPLAFWARRQAHETAIHCVDAEAAAGDPSRFPADLALDGIDELLHGFFARPGGRLVADPPVVLGIRPTDAEGGWSVRVEPDRRVVSAGVDGADCTISGPASELYLLLWNRRDVSDPIVITGDPRVLDHWREHGRI